MLAIKITFITIVSFCIGFFAGAIWYSIGRRKKEIESDTFDESEIYNPKLKIIKGEKVRR